MSILDTPQRDKTKWVILLFFIYFILNSVTILTQEPRFRLIRQETTDSKGVRTLFVWEYDRNNRCIKKQYDTTADFYGYTITYSYDNSGNKIKYVKQIENDGTAYEIYTYNKAGLISTRESKSELGHHTLTTYEYDDSGNTVKSHEVNIENNSPLKTVLYTYNAKNQPTREEIHYFDGGRNSVTTYIYDERNNLIEELLSWEGRDMVYQNTYHYDDRGRKVKQIKGYKGAEKKTTITLTYDEKDRLTVYKQTGSSYKLKTYEYDDGGNNIKEFHDNGGYNFTHAHTYDTHGNRVKTVFTDSKGESRTTIYTYETY